MKDVGELERLLEEQAREFQFLVRNATDPIWVSRDGVIVEANQALAELLDRDDPEKLIDSDVLDLFYVDDQKGVQRELGRLKNTGESTPSHQVRMLRKDETVIAVEVIALFLHYRGVPSIVWQGRDLSYRQSLTTQMMQMDRMIAAGTLAAGVGHEINNPLTFIIANLDYATHQINKLTTRTQEEEGLDETFQFHVLQVLPRLLEALDSARQGSYRITTIVKELRTFSSQAGKPELTAVDIHPVLNSARQMCWHMIRHRAKYVENLRAISPVKASQSRLAQVFHNLLTNAAQAIEIGHAEDHEIRVSSWEEGDVVIMEFSDTGSGISRSDLPHIFDPFFTTKSPDEGTGLGLSIAKQVLSKIGGHIEYRPQNEDTTFRLYLPKAKLEPLPKIPRITPEDESKIPEDYRVLVVDDEENIGKVLTRMLSNYEVIAFQRGDDALQYLADAPDFDCIFCDLLMPEMTGMEFYHRLVETHPQLSRSVIFITGGALVEEVQEFLADGNKHTLFKPFSRSAVLSAVINHYEDVHADPGHGSK